MNSQPRPYFRRDRQAGISPPNPANECSFAEHIVHARGKRTCFTSVSLDPARIRDFGDTTYRLKRMEAEADGHEFVEHETLLDALRRVIRDQNEAERARAIQALRYATRRREGLVRWRFGAPTIARKDLIAWAEIQVQGYFTRA